MDYFFRPGFQYYKLYKPFGVLSQFTPDQPGQLCLKDILKVSKDVYPVGRLDKDSEGLLILSNDPFLNDWLLNPKKKRNKTYWVQLEGTIDDSAIQMLLDGVEIRVNKKVHKVFADACASFEKDPILPERIPPIRKRESIPTSWCSVSITQGKNRQVRRMFAKVGFPVLRLVRSKIEDVDIEGMQPTDLIPLV